MNVYFLTKYRASLISNHNLLIKRKIHRNGKTIWFH